MRVFNLSNKEDRRYVSAYVTKMNKAYDRFIDSLSFKQYQAWQALAIKENSTFEYTLKINAFTRSKNILNLFDTWILQVREYRNNMQIID